MAKQWITPADLAEQVKGMSFPADEWSGVGENPLVGSLRADLDYMWEQYLPSLGFRGPIKEQVIVGEATGEGSGTPIYEPRFTKQARDYITQLQNSGYDLVAFAPNWQARNRTFALRTPTGEITAQQTIDTGNDVADFFRQFLLPAAGAAFTMGGGLNALMGGGAAAAPANALTGAGLGAMEGVGLSGNIVNAATGQTIAAAPISVGSQLADLTARQLASEVPLAPPAGTDVLQTSLFSPPPSAAASAPIFDLGGNVINPVTSEILSPASTTPGTLPPLTPLTPGAGAKPGLTGIPALDKAIDLVTSPAGQAVVGAAGSVAGGVMQANAAEAAANQQAEAARNALQLQWEMFEYQKGLLEPYRTAGTAALKRLEGALGLGGTAQAQQMLEMDPGYGFRLGEGMKALERMQAARGNMLSGGALKAGQRYAQDYASGEYQNAYNRLANIAGLGQTVGGQLGSAAQQFGTSAGNVMGQEANALAAGRIGRGSAYSGAIQGGLNAFQNYFNRQQEEKLFRDIFGRTAVGD